MGVADAVKHMWEAPDFHFDAMAQIRMDSWSRGNVVLLGDAGYCGSPLSGQGTSMALVGAYVLAGELSANPSTAFGRYEEILRPYVLANQDVALKNQANGEPPADFADIVNSFIFPSTEVLGRSRRKNWLRPLTTKGMFDQAEGRAAAPDS